MFLSFTMREKKETVYFFFSCSCKRLRNRTFPKIFNVSNILIFLRLFKCRLISRLTIITFTELIQIQPLSSRFTFTTFCKSYKILEIFSIVLFSIILYSAFTKFIEYVGFKSFLKNLNKLFLSISST